MSIFYEPDIDAGIFFLNQEESRHCVKVLRKKKGDRITIIDGKGKSYLAEIQNGDAKKCSFSVLESTTEKAKNFNIHIAIAPTKNIDRIEWFVEKAVEIGIDEISFVLCTNSERKNVNHTRIFKKAISAAKQSLKASIPTIHPMVSLKDFFYALGPTDRYIAYVDFDNPEILSKVAPLNSNYCVLIGPEGDFSSAELQLALDNGFTKVSLGPSRLRTETAGLVACHSLNLINMS